MSDAEILAQMEDQFADVEDPEVEDVSTWSAVRLVSVLKELDTELGTAGQLMRPDNQDARDLHSLRAAIIIEMKNRRLL